MGESKRRKEKHPDTYGTMQCPGSGLEGGGRLRPGHPNYPRPKHAGTSKVATSIIQLASMMGVK